ncbi:unnamed protein product [Anisakis simplex]|uniref:Peptidase M13 N-terminal domain-containing protein n=1 Tax=Anisakis simplex TaxID=6269 RepID=A0A3P6PD45_ANISI|nr:unnamed protein product [Anisakis simplex]
MYESKDQSHSRAINNIRQIYTSCMDQQRLAQLGGTELVKAIEVYYTLYSTPSNHTLHRSRSTQMGYWPIVHGEKWHANDFDLTNLLIYTSVTRSMEIFLDIYVSQDQRNVSRRMIHVDQGSLGLGGSARAYYLNMTRYTKQMRAYRQYMINKILLVAEDAGEPRTREEIAKGVEEIIDLEKQIAEIMISEEHRRNYTRLYNSHKLSELNELFPLVDWDRYFRAVMPEDLHDYLNTDPDIIVNEMEFLKKLTDLLRAADPRIITNYIVWRYTSAWSFQLDSRYDDVQQDFLRMLIGKERKSPRWKDCSSAASSRMAYAASALYVREYFNEADKNAAMEMIRDLHEAFREMVTHNDWMDEQTRKIAIEKSRAMQSLIGYPDFVLSDEKLDDFYKLLKFEPGDTYAAMVQKTTKWKQDRAFRRLIEPVDKSDFGISSSTVNAFYSSLKNSITFPAAVLQSPLFDRSFPK